MFLVFCLVGRMNYLDDCVDDVGDAVRGLDIGREDGGLGSIGVGESDGCSGGSDENSGGDGLSSDGLNWSGCHVLGLNLGSDHVAEEDLGEGFLVGEEGVESVFVDLGEGGVVGGKNGEWSSCNSQFFFLLQTGVVYFYQHLSTDCSKCKLKSHFSMFMND